MMSFNGFEASRWSAASSPPRLDTNVGGDLPFIDEVIILLA